MRQYRHDSFYPNQLIAAPVEFDFRLSRMGGQSACAGSGLLAIWPWCVRKSAPPQARNRPDNVEQQFSRSGFRVDAISDAPKPDLPGFQLLQDVDHVFQRPPQPIQLPDDQHVTRPKLPQQPGQHRVRSDLAGHFLHKHLVATALTQQVGL